VVASIDKDLFRPFHRFQLEEAMGRPFHKGRSPSGM
jgi:hypothetical protein